jgi:23S rRNA (uridine2552-2'-O)-methyltransferase
VKTTHRWEDHYSRQAKKERYPARSVYKLKEIQQKHHLIQQGDKVLDLGCSPGSWLLYAATLAGSAGQVVGVDLKPVSVALPPHVTVHTADVFSWDAVLLQRLGNDFNAVISDMAPAITGIKAVDAVRSFDLCQTALSIATDCLLPGGSFLCKLFQGEDFKRFTDGVKGVFHKQKVFKPKSSRKGSRELYIIGMGRR